MLALIVVLFVACSLVWLLQTYAPAPFKVIGIVLVVLFACLWALMFAGVIGPFPRFR